MWRTGGDEAEREWTSGGVALLWEGEGTDCTLFLGKSWGNEGHSPSSEPFPLPWGPYRDLPADFSAAQDLSPPQAWAPVGDPVTPVTASTRPVPQEQEIKDDSNMPLGCRLKPQSGEGGVEEAADPIDDFPH